MDTMPALQIDPATLMTVVRRIVGQESAHVANWSIVPLSGGFSGSHVYHVTGTAMSQSGAAPWAVVLKVLRADPLHDVPAGWAYWRREALVYASGHLDHLEGGLRAPRCFLVEEEASGSICLWLEALDAPEATLWSSANYAMIARTFGRFNGAFLTGRPIPSAPWLAPSWLRAHVEARAPAVALLAAQRDHALVRLVWPASNIAGALRLWEERLLLLAALDRLPQTFVHRDATPRNLMVHPRDVGTIVSAIDWGLAGPGVVGEDVGSLLLGQLTLSTGVAAAAGELDRTIFDAYLDGLRMARLAGAGTVRPPRLYGVGGTACVPRLRGQQCTCAGADDARATGGELPGGAWVLTRRDGRAHCSADRRRVGAGGRSAPDHATAPVRHPGTKMPWIYDAGSTVRRQQQSVPWWIRAS